MVRQVAIERLPFNWPRYAVIDILTASTQALTAHQIYDLARQSYTMVGLVSVYQTLIKLEELNLIQRVHEPEKCQAYIAAFDGHQHMLVCQRCGWVVFFDGDNLDGLITRVERESGYQVKEHWLQLFGICKQCRKKALDETLE